MVSTSGCVVGRCDDTSAGPDHTLFAQREPQCRTEPSRPPGTPADLAFERVDLHAAVLAHRGHDRFDLAVLFCLLRRSVRHRHTWSIDPARTGPEPAEARALALAFLHARLHTCPCFVVGRPSPRRVVGVLGRQRLRDVLEVRLLGSNTEEEFGYTAECH